MLIGLLIVFIIFPAICIGVGFLLQILGIADWVQAIGGGIIGIIMVVLFFGAAYQGIKERLERSHYEWAIKNGYRRIDDDD